MAANICYVITLQGQKMTNTNPSTIYSKAYEVMFYPFFALGSSTCAHFAGIIVAQMFIAAPFTQNIPHLFRVPAAEILHEVVEGLINGAVAVNLYDNKGIGLKDIMSPIVNKPIKTLFVSLASYGGEKLLSTTFSFESCCAPLPLKELQFCQEVGTPLPVKTGVHHIFSSATLFKGVASSFGAFFGASLYDQFGGSAVDEYFVSSSEHIHEEGNDHEEGRECK